MLAFVAAHSLEPIALADVAAAVDRTPSYVATAVREETGLTVGDWLREHRSCMLSVRQAVRQGGDCQVARQSIGELEAV